MLGGLAHCAVSWRPSGCAARHLALQKQHLLFGHSRLPGWPSSPRWPQPSAASSAVAVRPGVAASAMRSEQGKQFYDCCILTPVTSEASGLLVGFTQGGMSEKKVF